MNPDYEYLFFDDAQVAKFVDQEFPEYRSVFDSFKYPIQRYDFFRYLSVYRYGGFYFDVDVLLASDLSALLELGCVFPFEALTISRFLRDNLGMDWLVGNYAFGATPGHPFLQAIIENCVRGQRDPDWVKPMMRGSPPLLGDEYYILNSTGPGVVSRTLAENGDLAKTLTVLFPDDVCDLRNWNRFGDYGIHLANSSWRRHKSFARDKFSGYCWRWIQHRRVKKARKFGKTRYHPDSISEGSRAERVPLPARIPLVSILIPAYNADRWVAEAISSATAQTWSRKEIILIDDGSTDQTLAIARQFQSGSVCIVRQDNQGAAAARNHALQLSQGDYIQYLDADDLMAPDKIERQLAALREGNSKRTLLSAPWAPFYYRTSRARFVRSSLWQDLSPAEWLMRKMGENLGMQTATWLTSRELVEAAGPWDTRLCYDDDGEYFCRVLSASEGTRFVPEAKVFYRVTPSNRLSYIGSSPEKIGAMFLSMKLHVQYLRSLEDSQRVRRACLAYLQAWYHLFYTGRPDRVAELQGLAEQLQGRLDPPHLRWKYAWMKPLVGRKAANYAQIALPQVKTFWLRQWDRVMFKLEAGEVALATPTTLLGSIDRIRKGE
jgi:glycosyltransferase involved in cell wall biosynthesis